MSTQISPVASSDLHAVAEIYNEYIRMGNATMDETIKTAEDIQAWVEKFNDRERLYVMREGNSIIGWGIIKRYSDREGYRFTCETAVYLSSASIGKGYGSKMKRFLIKMCRELGYHHMVAKIFADNTASITYNQRLGYEVVGRQKEIGYKNGEWIDVVIMQLILTNPK